MKRATYPALLFVLVVAAAALVWHGGILRVSANTVQPDISSLSLLPAQSSAIFGADLDALRGTPVYSNWSQRANQEQEPEYSEFVARTGFDPQRDVAGVLAGAWKEGTEGRFVAVVTARYSPSAVAAFLKEKGAAAEQYRGFELLMPGEAHDADRPALAMLDSGVLLVGTETAVRQAIDRKLDHGDSVLMNQALLARVQQIGIENQVWAVTSAASSLLPPQPPSANQPNLARVLAGLQASTFAMNAAADIRLVAQGNCASEDDARLLADAARGMLAMMRLVAPANHPEALEALNSFQVEQQAAQVKVTAQIPEQLLDQLANEPEALIPHQHKSPSQHQAR
jgi:hypothetical protein